MGFGSSVLAMVAVYVVLMLLIRCWSQRAKHSPRGGPKEGMTAVDSDD